MPVSDGSERGGAARLLEEEPGLVHFGLGDDPSALHADPVLLGGELGGGRGPSRPT